MGTAIEHELESLLRGEIAAAETYNLVLERTDGSEAAPLREVQRDHGEAIKVLYEQLVSRGGEPPTSSGIWGFFARSLEGAASVLSDKVALSALREGEKKGLKDYRHALEFGLLPTDCRRYFEQTLIPAQQRHIDMLTRMIDSH